MTNTAQMGTRRSTSTTRTRDAAPARGGVRRGDARRGGARRRTGWALTLMAAVVIVAGGAFASIEPYREYQDASSRLADQQAKVAVLEQENEVLQAEVQRLQRPSYIEALARKDLNLGRPGEEIIVVEGIPSSTTQAPEEGTEPRPGPLERLVRRIRSLW